MRSWKRLTNLWTLITISLFTLDFLSHHRYPSGAASVGAIYIGILGLYVGTKEFDRWQHDYASTAKGERFIVAWTAIVIAMALWAVLSGGRYTLPTEIVATYIAVLSVFALSQRSKFLNTQRRKR